MKPPRCSVCHRTLADTAGELDGNFELIYFGETEADKFGPSLPEDVPIAPGHPSNAVWFCIDHVSLGREYEDMPAKEALAAISRLVGSPPGHHGRLG
jgi:hypothetical protein